MAFDLKEPWATHRKYEVFEDKHSDLFGRPEVTADRIVVCQVIIEAIRSQMPKLENQLFARYVLSEYALLYIVREILDKDELAVNMLRCPDRLVRNTVDRDRFRQIVTAIVSDIVSDLNEEMKDVGSDFDYRDKLRDAEWIKSIRKTLIATHSKLISRKFIKSFKDEWEAGNSPDCTKEAATGIQ